MQFSSVKSKVIQCGEKSFGLKIIYPSGRCREITNITSDVMKLTALSDRINSLGVSELHIDYIIEDFLP